MTSGTPDKVVHCPECGADNDERRPKCWLCGANVVGGVATRDFARPGTAHAPPQFALSSLFLIVTLLCVCLGLASIAPGLIVPLLVIVVPALIRSVSASQRRTRGGAPLTIADKFAAFFASLGIVVLIGVAGIIAFLAACLVGLGVFTVTPVGNQARNEMGVALLFSVIGGIAAIVLMVWLFIRTWPGKR